MTGPVLAASDAKYSPGADTSTLTSVAFPSIATGVYGYPRDEAAEVSSRVIEKFLANDLQLKEVRLVFFQSEDAEIFLTNQKFSG